jgi:hypothetical protein
VNARTPPQPPVRVWPLWFAALTLAACETWIDFDARAGLNWLLSTLLMSTAFMAFLKAGCKPLNAERCLPLVTACAMAGGAVVSSNPGVDAFVVMGVVMSLAVGLLLGGSAAPRQELSPREYLVAPATAGTVALREAGARLGEAARILRAGESVPAVRGVAIATPITVVLGLLLSNADPVMAAWRDNVWKTLIEMTFLGRTLFFGAAGVLMLGSLGQALRPVMPAGDRGRLATGISKRLGNTERTIILSAVVALFALFLVLQLSHFFDSAADIRGTGLTYAQAAHEGFAELTIAASLCALLLMALSQASGAAGLQRGEKVLSVVLIVEAQILLLSAFHRIVVYEDIYGFTELRLLVQLYEGCVLMALGLLIVEVLAGLNLQRLSRHCAVTAAIALLGLIYWNHSAWITRENLARYERSGILDARYLVRALGPDAVPALLSSLPGLPTAMQTRLRSCLRDRYTPTVIDGLRHQAWYEWSYRRSRLTQALDQSGLIANTDGAPVPLLGKDPCN